MVCDILLTIFSHGLRIFTLFFHFGLKKVLIKCNQSTFGNSKQSEFTVATDNREHNYPFNISGNFLLYPVDCAATFCLPESPARPVGKVIVSLGGTCLHPFSHSPVHNFAYFTQEEFLILCIFPYLRANFNNS